jgi:hypothetical protein
MGDGSALTAGWATLGVLHEHLLPAAAPHIG